MVKNIPERQLVMLMEQTRELIRRAQAGDMTATRLVEENLPLVKALWRFLSRGFDFDDLFQVGPLPLKPFWGLISYDVQFSTCA